MKKLFSFSALCASLLVGIGACTANPAAKAQVVEEPVDSTKRISLLFAGDLMMHAPQFNAAKVSGGGYDFSDCFAAMKAEIEDADVAIANFETTTAGAPYSGYPQFCAPDEYLVAIKDAGFDLLTTNNNHSCDRRAKGIDRTILMMDSLGISHLGTYVNEAERQKQYPYLLEKNGMRIVLLTYTYGTNGIHVPEGKVVNLIDKEQMTKDIQKAKQMKPDAIIAIMHWGTEYTMKPVKSQVELADWLLSQGVTHIIGGHPHVVEPLELRTDSVTGEKHVVAYSMGNFISNMIPTPAKTTDGGMIIRFELVKDSTVHVEDVRYSLQWVSRPNMSGKKVHRVLPVNIPQDQLNNSEKSAMQRFLDRVRPMFASGNKGEVREYECLTPNPSPVR